MVSFSRTHYQISLGRPFARGALPAGGVHWPEEPTGLKVGAMAPLDPLAMPLLAQSFSKSRDSQRARATHVHYNTHHPSYAPSVYGTNK